MATLLQYRCRVSQATRSVTEWLLPLYQQVGQAVRDLPVAHADETSHYRNSGKDAANGLLDEFDGILVTDQHGGYNDYPIEKRQLCWAHVIRKFKKISERVGRGRCAGETALAIIPLDYSLP